MDHLTSGTHLFRTRREHFCTLPGSSPTLNNARASLCACVCMLASTNRSSRWCEGFFSIQFMTSFIHSLPWKRNPHRQCVSGGPVHCYSMACISSIIPGGQKTSAKSFKYKNQIITTIIKSRTEGLDAGWLFP